VHISIAELLVSANTTDQLPAELQRSHMLACFVNHQRPACLCRTHGQQNVSCVEGGCDDVPASQQGDGVDGKHINQMEHGGKVAPHITSMQPHLCTTLQVIHHQGQQQQQQSSGPHEYLLCCWHSWEFVAGRGSSVGRAAQCDALSLLFNLMLLSTNELSATQPAAGAMHLQ